MRKKPSMFSKNYRKELKKRRIKRIALLIVALTMVVLTITSYDKGKNLVKNYFQKNYTDDIEHEDNLEDKEGHKTSEDQQREEGEETEEEKMTITYEAKLESGKLIVIEYENENSKKIVSNIILPERTSASISPSKEKVLLIDEDTQDIYIVENSEEVINITNPQYISTNNEVFTKESVIQYNPSYKWIQGAGFIDDTHIAYGSQLPWINGNGELYLWSVNLSDKTHLGHYNIKGSNIEFEETVSEGIRIKVDDKILIVNSQGKIVSQ